jgi:hypothetical protein
MAARRGRSEPSNGLESFRQARAHGGRWIGLAVLGYWGAGRRRRKATLTLRRRPSWRALAPAVASSYHRYKDPRAYGQNPIACDGGFGREARPLSSKAAAPTAARTAAPPVLLKYTAIVGAAIKNVIRTHRTILSVMCSDRETMGASSLAVIRKSAMPGRAQVLKAHWFCQKPRGAMIDFCTRTK